MCNTNKRYEASKQYHKIDTRLDDMCKTHLNELATETITQSMDFSARYQSIRIAFGTWLLVLSPEHATCTELIARMKHVRTVTLLEDKITCTCELIPVYGVPCRHIFHVAYTIPNWTRPTHRDVSVRYWTAYFYYGITENLVTDLDITIHKMLKLIRIREIVGVHVNLDDLSSIPIQTLNVNIPSIYHQLDSQPFARNYPDVDYSTICLSEEANNIPGMSQYENIVNNEDDDDYISFAHLSEEIPVNSSGNMVSPYQYLVASFKELTSIMDGNCDNSELDLVNNFFNEQVGAFKHKISVQQNKHKTTNTGTYVSSNVASSKKRKARRCKGY